MKVPNLAREPFANHRPVRRLTAVLWVLAGLLLAVDGWLYWDHFAGRDEQRLELAALESRMAVERRQLDETMADLERFDLDWQRDQVGFLNARIAERTFSWSALFDHLAEVLPRAVRIERVTPRLATSRQSRRRQAGRGHEDEVLLEMTGAAEVDEVLLELLDGFFAHERFRRPNLKQEARQGSAGQVEFSMTVVYRPEAPGLVDEPVEEPEPPVEAAEEQPAGIEVQS